MEGILSQNGITTYIILSALAALLLFWVLKKSTKNPPPGPRGWRTTWAILKAIKDASLHELALDWAKKYGPLTYISYLGQQVLCLNSADIARRLLASEDSKYLIGNRGANIAARVSEYNGKDLIFTQYDAFSKKKRRMFYSIIGTYGDGVEAFETLVAAEMDRFMAELEQHENQDFELSKSLATSLKVLIHALLLGDLPDDIDKLDIMEEYDISFNRLFSPYYDLVLTKLPILAKIPGPIKNAVNRLKRAKDASVDLLYYEPKKTWVPGYPRGFTDLLFEQEVKPGNEWMKSDPQHAIGFILSLFWAGHLTTRASMLGMFLCLINNPSVTKKLHDEIDHVIGDRKPTMDDKSNMPYTEATILESLRLISQVPLGAARLTSGDIDIDGVTIPKDTVVLLNAWAYHHDEDIYADPWTFKPERFLDDQGQILPPDHTLRKNLLPFGAGLRSCPGEIFSRSRVFMFMISILQKYDVLPPANEKLVPADFRTNHDDVKGFIRQVSSFKCRLQRRQKSL